MANMKEQRPDTGPGEIEFMHISRDRLTWPHYPNFDYYHIARSATSHPCASFTMLSTTATIPVPTYEPSPYALAGRPFKLLPPLARYFLADVVGVIDPKDATPQLIQDHRDALKCTFFRALQGNDEWLVREWRAIQKRRSLAAQGMEALGPSESEEQFLMVLLPEREGLFREFVGKFDALVWLELEGRQKESALTEDEQKRYRDEMCGLKEALDYPKKALEALDRQVAGLLKEKASTPVKLYFEQNVFPVSVPSAVATPAVAPACRTDASWRPPRSPGGRRNSDSRNWAPFAAAAGRKRGRRAEVSLKK